MKLLAPIAIAFGMFSRIPTPMVDWNKKNMRYALCAFPLVGLVQGGVALLWGGVASFFSLPATLLAAGFTLLPIALNGGIHLDGLCDTADALASHAPREKKFAILQDPHLGAFGALALVCHLLLTYLLYYNLTPSVDNLLCLLCMYAFSRTCSGWAVVSWPTAKTDGSVHRFSVNSDGKKPRVILAVTAVFIAAACVALKGVHGLAVCLSAIAVLLYYRWMARRQFGGITGDLAGWFLQTAELWMLGILVLGGIVS